MTRKAITFLGTLPKQTTYLHQGRTYSGQVFAEALRQFADLDEMLVFTTAGAGETTWPILARLGDPRLRRIDIPNGENTAELWRLFDCLTGEIAQGDTVIFDITHGLRSLPFLVFLAAAYLKAAKQVTIEAIYYGAYELGKPAPVIDLSEFVTLLDWLTAAERFTQTGDGRPLAVLLREQIPPGMVMGEDLEARALGNGLKQAAAAIESISLALRVTRPMETMEAAARLDAALQQAQPAIAARARPFAPLAGQVRDAYARFALPAPLDYANWAANLRLQLAIVRWYLDKGQVVQAATLAREWLVSLVIHRVQGDSLVDLDGVRGPVEGALNNICRQKAGKPLDRPSAYDDLVAALPECETLTSIWGRLRDLRNDIAHVGMNERPKEASKLCRDMVDIYPLLEALTEGLQ